MDEVPGPRPEVGDTREQIGPGGVRLGASPQLTEGGCAEEGTPGAAKELGSRELPKAALRDALVQGGVYFES